MVVGLSAVRVDVLGLAFASMKRCNELKRRGFKMRHAALVARILISVCAVLGSLPEAVGGPTEEKLARDATKGQRRRELEIAVDRASRSGYLSRSDQEIVRIVPAQQVMSRYLDSNAGENPYVKDDEGLTVRRAMEKRLDQFEAAMEDARKYRKKLPLAPPEGLEARIAAEPTIDNRFNFDAFKKATLRAMHEYNQFNFYKNSTLRYFRNSFGRDLGLAPGYSQLRMSGASRTMDAFFKKAETKVFIESDKFLPPEALFNKISDIERHLKRNDFGGGSLKMQTVLREQLEVLKSTEEHGVKVIAGEMRAPTPEEMAKPRDMKLKKYDLMKVKQEVGLQFQSALSKAKELRAKTGGSGPLVIFATATSLVASTAAQAGEAEAIEAEGSPAEFNRSSWARPSKAHGTRP